MKFAIISGSTRHNNPQSKKVAKYVEYYLNEKLHEKTYLLDLSITNIKFWDESFWDNESNFDPNWQQAKAELDLADAIIVVAPEWNGMLPPALKNIFHLAVKGEFANKPALIISLSASVNGVYPITELRLNSFKNTFINYIPEQVIIRNVNTVLNDLEQIADENDQKIRKRINYTLQILQVYAKAFIEIRMSDIIRDNPYNNGM